MEDRLGLATEASLLPVVPPLTCKSQAGASASASAHQLSSQERAGKARQDSAVELCAARAEAAETDGRNDRAVELARLGRQQRQCLQGPLQRVQRPSLAQAAGRLGGSTGGRERAMEGELLPSVHPVRSDGRRKLSASAAPETGTRASTPPLLAASWHAWQQHWFQRIAAAHPARQSRPCRPCTA